MYSVTISPDVLRMARAQVTRPHTSVPQVPLHSLRIPISEAVRAPKPAALKAVSSRKTQAAAVGPWDDVKAEIKDGLARGADELLYQWMVNRSHHTAAAADLSGVATAVSDAVTDLSGSSLAIDAGINDIGKHVGTVVEAIRPEDLSGAADAVSGAIGGIADAISSFDFN